MRSARVLSSAGGAAPRGEAGRHGARGERVRSNAPFSESAGGGENPGNEQEGPLGDDDVHHGAVKMRSSWASRWSKACFCWAAVTDCCRNSGSSADTGSATAAVEPTPCNDILRWWYLCCHKDARGQRREAQRGANEKATRAKEIALGNNIIAVNFITCRFLPSLLGTHFGVCSS